MGVVVWGLVLAGAAAGRTPAQRAAIAQALDKPIELSVENQPLPDVLRAISRRAGVPVHAAEDVLALLPYGAQTRVSATFKAVSLREGLRRLLGPIGMGFEVRGGRIELTASGPLLRIGRPATWQELATLERLAGEPWSAKLAEALPLQFQVPGEEDPKARLLAQAGRVGAGRADEVLEAACRALGWTWYPWEGRIVVLRQEDQAARALERRVSLRFEHRPLTEVLLALGARAGLVVRMQPGAIAALPRQTRESFSLLVDNTSIRQALELIAGVTGLRYAVEPGAIVIGLPQAATRPVYRRDPFVGKITIPSKSGRYQFDLLIRESDLPPEVNELRKRKVREAVEAMKRELGP